MAKKLSAKGRDKAATLLKLIAADCADGDEHEWRTCPHCLAVEELGHNGVRALLRAYLESAVRP